MDRKVMQELAQKLAIPSEDLRWQCNEAWLDFETTADVEPIATVVGQDDALAALQFGLETVAPGQNIYVRGLTGTGRATLVEQLLTDIGPPCPQTPDRCYVHNFDQPDQPRLLTVARGQGVKLAERMDRLIQFIEEQLGPQLSSDAVRSRRWALDEKVQASIREVGKPFEEELRAAELALVPIQVGQVIQPTILPLVKGEPVSLDKLDEMVQQGSMEATKPDEIRRRISDFARRFEDLNLKVNEIQQQHSDALNTLYEEEARRILRFQVERITKEFGEAEVDTFLQRVVDDLITHRLHLLGTDSNFTSLYRVNPLLSRPEGEDCPVIRETSPSLQNLLGNVDREFSATGTYHSDHMMIHAGSLLRADGGYLVLEVRDVLAEPGSWKVLLRALKTGLLDIVPSELAYYLMGPLLTPEPVPLNVKVILIGDPGLYQMLDYYDPDFPHLFKVLADFDNAIPRDQQGVLYYAGVLAKIISAEDLLPFDRCAVMAMSEHGARIAGERSKLTMRFGRVADVAREASHIAAKNGLAVVSREQVYEAVRRGRHRADLPARKYRARMVDGTIRINTEGKAPGQINGLAVIQSGPLTYGFPSRITASIGPGSAGTVSIERESDLSGAIHTKGFYILGGLLRNLLQTEHPLAFSASIAFEQSYGGIDGDSASGAEMVCLLSALAQVPLRQDLAMTGAIDQVGNIQPIGAVSEKVEGFYELCRDKGLTGEQGVVIPAANAADLMLNPELLQVCAEGKFHVYAVSTIHEALELFTGFEAGVADDAGNYKAGSLLHLAKSRAYEFWKKGRAGNHLPPGQKAE